MRLFRGFSTQSQNERNRTWKLYDAELVKQDLLNEFYTKKRERVMLPNFGFVAWDLLFDPFTDQVREQVINDAIRIIENDTRVELQNILVDEYERGLRVELSLRYVPLNAVETFSLTFDREAEERE